MLRTFVFQRLPFLVVLFVSCNLYDDSPTSPPNILNTKDSIAVRAILDANGLDTMKVRNVIFLKNSYIGEINLKSQSLNKFIFSRYLDSLVVSPSLNLQYNNIDTLIVPDSIQFGASVRLEYNKLRQIPDEIGKIKGNIAFYLINNQLTKISPNIMNCKVSYINVIYNNLCNTPDSISQWITKNCRDSTWKSTQTCQ
jgi:hypothetical protein